MIEALGTHIKNFDRREIIIGFSIVLVFATISFSITRQVIGRTAVVAESSPGEIEVSEEPTPVISDPVPVVYTPEIETQNIPVESLVSEDPEPPVLSLPRQQLLDPSFSLPSGSYLRSQFPLHLDIINPNNQLTWVMVSVNRGGFKEVRGSLEIYPEDYVQAYVRGESEKWIESGIVSFFCKVKPGHRRDVRVPLDRVRAGRRF